MPGVHGRAVGASGRRVPRRRAQPEWILRSVHFQPTRVSRVRVVVTCFPRATPVAPATDGTDGPPPTAGSSGPVAPRSDPRDERARTRTGRSGYVVERRPYARGPGRSRPGRGRSSARRCGDGSPCGTLEAVTPRAIVPGSETIGSDRIDPRTRVVGEPRHCWTSYSRRKTVGGNRSSIRLGGRPFPRPTSDRIRSTIPTSAIS